MTIEKYLTLKDTEQSKLIIDSMLTKHSTIKALLFYLSLFHDLGADSFDPDTFQKEFSNKFSKGRNTIFMPFILKNSLYVVDDVGKLYRLSNQSKI